MTNNFWWLEHIEPILLTLQRIPTNGMDLEVEDNFSIVNQSIEGKAHHQIWKLSLFSLVTGKLQKSWTQKEGLPPRYSRNSRNLVNPIDLMNTKIPIEGITTMKIHTIDILPRIKSVGFWDTGVDRRRTRLTSTLPPDNALPSWISPNN
ncbi:MAG: hypothetical protein QNJ63_22105, partial [Calothrix sp. MO_192.B10]|nr:hypothetical protein [Calothrix sp. MO_192.B10]